MVTDPQTDKPTNRQDRLQYTAHSKLSAQCNYSDQYGNGYSHFDKTALQCACTLLT